jgi:hypothetical protein
MNEAIFAKADRAKGDPFPKFFVNDSAHQPAVGERELWPAASNAPTP